MLTFGALLVLSSTVFFGFLPAIGAISRSVDHTLKRVARSGTASHPDDGQGRRW